MSRFVLPGNTPQYLSQIKSEFNQTFRISSWGSLKMIQHVKDDPIFQVSSQEPVGRMPTNPPLPPENNFAIENLDTEITFISEKTSQK